MRPTLLASCALLAFAALGCAPSPQEMCRKMVDQLCERNFACRPDKDTAPFKYAYGADVNECKTKYYDINGCDVRQEDAQNCVGPNAGKTEFSASRFADCQEALDGLSCAEYVNQQNDPKLAPAVCREMCQ